MRLVFLVLVAVVGIAGCRPMAVPPRPPLPDAGLSKQTKDLIDSHPNQVVAVDRAWWFKDERYLFADVVVAEGATHAISVDNLTDELQDFWNASHPNEMRNPEIPPPRLEVTGGGSSQLTIMPPNKIGVPYVFSQRVGLDTLFAFLPQSCPIVRPSMLREPIVSCNGGPDGRRVVKFRQSFLIDKSTAVDPTQVAIVFVPEEFGSAVRSEVPVTNIEDWNEASTYR